MMVLYLSGFEGKGIKSLMALKQMILKISKILDWINYLMFQPVKIPKTCIQISLYWLISVNGRHLNYSPAEVDFKGSDHNICRTMFK